MPTEPAKVKSGLIRSENSLSPTDAREGQGSGGRLHPGLAAAVIAPDELWQVRGPAAPRRAGLPLHAVLFDLDGVLVNTAEFHYRAWQRLADETGLPFDRKRNEAFRGVGRMECLDMLLGSGAATVGADEKCELADRKNRYYLAMVETLTPRSILPGARTLVMELRANGISMGLVSASRNARRVLDLTGISPWFDTVVDGNDVSRSKPDPEGFLIGADRLGARPQACLVVEDAAAGIAAGMTAGMKTIAVGTEAGDGADLTVADLRLLELTELCALWAPHARRLAG